MWRVTFLSLSEMSVGKKSAKVLFRIGFLMTAAIIVGLVLLHQELSLPHLPGGRFSTRGGEFTGYGLAAAAMVAVQGVFLSDAKWSYEALAHFLAQLLFFVAAGMTMYTAGYLYTPSQFMPKEAADTDEYWGVREAVDAAASSLLLKGKQMEKLVWLRHNVIIRVPPALCGLLLLASMVERCRRSGAGVAALRIRNLWGLAQMLLVLGIAWCLISFGAELETAAMLALPTEKNE